MTSRQLVLIVEDNEELSMLMEKQLTKMGLDVMKAYDAQRAKELIEKYEFSVVLLDLVLPGVNGLSFLQHIKKNVLTEDINVIITSAVKDQRVVLKAMDLGADDYIIKPLDFDLLSSKMQMILKDRDLLSLPTLPVSPNSRETEISISFDLRILQISEMGLVLRSPALIKKRATFKIFSPLFADIGINAPLLSVADSSLHAEDDKYFELITHFEDVPEDDITKIRGWLMRLT